MHVAAPSAAEFLISQVTAWFGGEQVRGARPLPSKDPSKAWSADVELLDLLSLHPSASIFLTLYSTSQQSVHRNTHLLQLVPQNLHLVFFLP